MPIDWRNLETVPSTGRSPCEDGDGDWGGAATSGTPKMMGPPMRTSNAHSGRVSGKLGAAMDEVYSRPLPPNSHEEVITLSTQATTGSWGGGTGQVLRALGRNSPCRCLDLRLAAFGSGGRHFCRGGEGACIIAQQTDTTRHRVRKSELLGAPG